MNKREKEQDERRSAALDEFEATKEAVFEALDCSHEVKENPFSEARFSEDTLFKEFLKKLDRSQPEEVMGEFGKFVDTPGNFAEKAGESEYDIIQYFKDHFCEAELLMIYGWYCKNWRPVWDWVHTRPKKTANKPFGGIKE